MIPRTQATRLRRSPTLLIGLAALGSLVLSSCSTDPKQAAAKSDLPPGIKLVETFDGAGKDIAIPYSKYELDNGLTVVLHEDHSDPLVHVDVTYHVGSNREEVGRSGFAHFFEHMMFQGSENVGDDEHFKIVSNAGGTLNGTTNSDRTNYFQTLPVNQLETALWLEADRMGFLLPAVSEVKFENQRETVKNERAQRVDNQPYGRAVETLMKNIYDESHPYSWPTIGWIEDLNRADLSDLKRFFLRWYGPNNAVLTIGGDIDQLQTLEMVNKYFGPIPRGPAVNPLPKRPGKIDRDRYVTLEDNIHLPALVLGMPTVYRNHPDEPALDAAAKIMGQGQASLLYQRLVQSGRAVQASVQHQCREVACEMWFIVVQNPGSGESLAEMEAAVREMLNEFAGRGVSQDDLDKFKAVYESGRVFGLQSVAGKVSTLAAFETFSGTPAGIDEEIQKYLNVSVDDVNRVYEQYVAGKASVALSIVPNGKTELAARPQNYDAPERNIPADLGGDDALALRPPQDAFDRSEHPVPSSNPSVELPPVWEATLPNGAKVLGVFDKETPTTTVRTVFRNGSRDEPAGKAGLAQLMGAMMGEATTQRSAAEFSAQLERIGGRLGANVGTYETNVTLGVLSKNLDQGVDLLMERMLEPAFDDGDFNRIKRQTLEGLQQARKTPGTLATRAVGAVMYGPEHVLSYPAAGLPGTVEGLTLDDTKRFYQGSIGTLDGVLVSSSLPKSAVLKALAPLGEMSRAGTDRRRVDAMKPISGRTIYLVDKPDAAQSSLRLVHPSVKYDALGDYYKAGLANFALGGTFSSRINLNLREDKGFTYGARSFFQGGPEFGRFGFSTEVNRDSTAASIKEILGEMERYDESGMTAEEFAYMRSAIGQRDAREYETPGRKMGLLGQVLRYDLPADYRQQQQSLLEQTSREALNEVAAKLLRPNDLAIVVVGDANTIRGSLVELNIPIVELDADGNRI